jgi:hypothetical protein
MRGRWRRRAAEAWSLLRGEAPEPPASRQVGTLEFDGTPCRARPADDAGDAQTIERIGEDDSDASQPADQGGLES